MIQTSFALVILTQIMLAQSIAAPVPRDVASFVSQRNLRDHFRGEDPYGEERAAFLAKSIEETCTGNDEHLRELKAKTKMRDRSLRC